MRVRTSVYSGMFHVFQMGLDLIPESREAWEEVGEFLCIVYKIQRKTEGRVVRRVKTHRPEVQERTKGLLLSMVRGEIAGPPKKGEKEARSKGGKECENHSDCCGQN